MEEQLIHLLPPKIFEVIDRAGISTPKQIIILSSWDIKKVTNLSTEDILLLKNTVSKYICPKSDTCYELLREHFELKTTSGCKEINDILNGGFQKGSITEIYGESGSGKTQIGLQAAAHNWPNCTVYICTEDLFPIKRYDEIKTHIPEYNPNVDYGSTIFVEHITESKDLFSCIKVRLPKLLVQNKFTLIVIDSIAAPFRVESTDYVQRAELMRELAMSLLSLAQKFKLAILCMNQVTASFNNMNDLPALGLAWSNMVCTRLSLKKTLKTINVKNEATDFKSHVRELSVAFAPDLPNNSFINFVVTSNGLQGFH